MAEGDLSRARLISIFKELINQLLVQEMDFLLGFKDKITNVEKSLPTIKAVLQDAEAKQHNSEAIKLWPKSVKYVMCDTDDLPDEISAVDLRRKVMIRDKICIDLNRYFFFLFLFFIAIFFLY